jgi:uncharacterized protein
VPKEAKSSNEELVRHFLAAMDRMDVGCLSDLLLEDASWWVAGDLPISGLYDGKSAIVGEFLATAVALFERGSLGFELRSIVHAGDFIAAEYVGAGRSAANGVLYRNTYCVVFGCREGKVASVREYLDTAHVRDVLYTRDI